MDVTPRLSISVEELVLDGVEPGSPLVARALERAVAQSLPAASAAGISPHAVATAVASAVRSEVSA